MEQIGPGRAFRDTQQSSDLTMPESLDVVEYDDRALPLGEHGESRMESGAKIRRFGGIVPAGRKILAQRVGVAHAPAARRVQGSVRDDAVKPRAKRLAGKKPIEGSERMEKAVLHRVLSILVSRNDGASDRVGSPLVRANECAKRFRITALRIRHQALLLGRAERPEGGRRGDVRGRVRR